MAQMESHSVDNLTIDCENLMISLKRVPFNVFIMSRLLDELAEAGVNVDVISRTAPIENTFEVSLIVLEKKLAVVKEIVSELQESHPEISVSINKNITRLSIHGIGMRTQPGVAAGFLGVFANNNIQILMITTSEICMSAIVNNDDAKRAVTAIKATFDL